MWSPVCRLYFEGVASPPHAGAGRILGREYLRDWAWSISVRLWIIVRFSANTMSRVRSRQIRLNTTCARNNLGGKLSKMSVHFAPKREELDNQDFCAPCSSWRRFHYFYVPLTACSSKAWLKLLHRYFVCNLSLVMWDAQLPSLFVCAYINIKLQSIIQQFWS